MTESLDTFMQILKGEPLSLCLVAMNLLLLWYCFRTTNQFTKARSEMSALIVDWQKQTQKLMADCVSKDVMDMVLKSLERDRETYTRHAANIRQARTRRKTMSLDENERIRALMRVAVDDAFKAHVMKLYGVWLSNPADMAAAQKRAAIGANTAIEVYRTAIAAVEQWEGN